MKINNYCLKSRLHFSIIKFYIINFNLTIIIVNNNFYVQVLQSCTKSSILNGIFAPNNKKVIIFNQQTHCSPIKNYYDLNKA